MNQRPIAKDPDALLHEVDAADLLGVSVRTLQAWRAAGIGPPVTRLGRAVRYRRSKLLKYIDHNTDDHSGSSGSNAPSSSPKNLDDDPGDGE